MAAALEQYFRDEVEPLPEGGVRSRPRAAAVGHDLGLHFFYSLCMHFPALPAAREFLDRLQ